MSARDATTIEVREKPAKNSMNKDFVNNNLISLLQILLLKIFLNQHLMMQIFMSHYFVCVEENFMLVFLPRIWNKRWNKNFI